MQQGVSLAWLDYVFRKFAASLRGSSPVRQSLAMAVRLSVVFLTFGPTIHPSRYARAQGPAWDANQAAVAVAELTSTVLDHCEYEFKVKGAINKPDESTETMTGSFGFYRCGESIIADIDLKRDGEKPGADVRRQIVKRPGHPFLELYYLMRPQRRGGPSRPARPTVLTNQVSDPVEQLTNNLGRIKLGHLLGYFATTDLTVKQIAEASAPNARVSPDGKVVSATLQSGFGRLTMTYALHGRRYLISGVTLEQSPDDRCHRAANLRLRDLTKGFKLPDDPAGFSSGTVTVRLSYAQTAQGELYLKEYTAAESYSNSRGCCADKYELQCARFERQKSVELLERHAVPIPNGTEVFGASSFPIRKMWSNGQIVRHSDETALRIASRLIGSRRLWFVLAPLILLAACAVFLLVRLRRSRKRARSVATN